eukprot:scaffold22680_cov107-Cylindrotheca_fusiformis.AAC.25
MCNCNSSKSSLIMPPSNLSDVQVVGNLTQKTLAKMMNAHHSHHGNRLFSRIVLKNRPTFQALRDVKSKKLLALSIVIAIDKNGGRFVNERKQELSKQEAFRITLMALSKSGMSTPKKVRFQSTIASRT